MKNIVYKIINLEEMEISIFQDFKRYQEVKKCWRKEEGEWILKDIEFIEEWYLDDYEKLVEQLKSTIISGGKVLGAFIDNRLLGFASIERQIFGSKNKYIQLSELYVSKDYRGMGIGRDLFDRIVEIAKSFNGYKLYISSHSSEETQKFYKKLGCVEAKEYNKILFEKEPYDCHLEFNLYK